MASNARADAHARACAHLQMRQWRASQIFGLGQVQCICVVTNAGDCTFDCMSRCALIPIKDARPVLRMAALPRSGTCGRTRGAKEPAGCL